MAFLERRSVLQVLSDHVRRQDCILTGKHVQKVEEDEKGATVFCADGTHYRGDIVVGADGVNSTVRHEMWRAVETQKTQLNGFNVDKERNGESYESWLRVFPEISG